MGKRTLLFAFLPFVLAGCKVHEHVVTDTCYIEKTRYQRVTDTLIYKEVERQRGDTIEKHYNTIEIRTLHDASKDTIYIGHNETEKHGEPFCQSQQNGLSVKNILLLLLFLLIFWKLLKIR